LVSMRERAPAELEHARRKDGRGHVGLLASWRFRLKGECRGGALARFGKLEGRRFASRCEHDRGVRDLRGGVTLRWDARERLRKERLHRRRPHLARDLVDGRCFVLFFERDEARTGGIAEGKSAAECEENDRTDGIEIGAWTSARAVAE